MDSNKEKEKEERVILFIVIHSFGVFKVPLFPSWYSRLKTDTSFLFPLMNQYLQKKTTEQVTITIINYYPLAAKRLKKRYANEESYYPSNRHLRF